MNVSHDVRTVSHSVFFMCFQQTQGRIITSVLPKMHTDVFPV